MTSFIFLKIFSDIPQRSMLGRLFFLTYIFNQSNDIASLVKRKYVHGHVCTYISGV